MDGPSVIFGPGHRSVRHDVKKIRTDPEYIPLKFREKYGLQLTRNIMLDHTTLDKNPTRRKKGKERILVSGRGIAHISHVILSNLQLSDTDNIEIPYIVCPDIVLLYNPERFDKLIGNLKLLLARLLLKRGDLDEARQILRLSEGLITTTTGEVAPEVG